MKKLILLTVIILFFTTLGFCNTVFLKNGQTWEEGNQICFYHFCSFCSLIKYTNQLIYKKGKTEIRDNFNFENAVIKYYKTDNSYIANAKLNDDKPQLKIVEQKLYRMGNFYNIKGKIYNPYDRACKNVIIKFYIWKNLKGVDRIKYGSIVTESGGLVSAIFDYFPPKTMLDFETAGKNAPVYTSMTPTNIVFEIEASWE